MLALGVGVTVAPIMVGVMKTTKAKAKAQPGFQGRWRPVSVVLGKEVMAVTKALEPGK